MMGDTYVISVKKIKDYYGKSLDENEQYWEYARDDTGSSLSTGYPCWCSEHGAKVFKSVKDAKKYYEYARQYLITTNNQDKYDWKTLAIRKRIYRKIENLM